MEQSIIIRLAMAGVLITFFVAILKFSSASAAKTDVTSFVPYNSAIIPAGDVTQQFSNFAGNACSCKMLCFTQPQCKAASFVSISGNQTCMLSNKRLRYWNLLRDNATITVLKASTLCNQTSGFKQVNGVGCILMGSYPLNWSKARDACHAVDSELFSVYDSPQPVYNAIWSELKRILPTASETGFKLWMGKRGDYWLKDSWWIDDASTLPCSNLQFNRTLADCPCSLSLWFLCQQMFT